MIKEQIVSKGDLMKLVYTKEELRRIDSAIPIGMWETHPPIKHCMNYNDGSVFGTCENIFEIAEKRGIKVPEYFNRIKNWKK